ncbi:MAG: hypothetical protein WCX65_17285 [bacterium]
MSSPKNAKNSATAKTTKGVTGQLTEVVTRLFEMDLSCDLLERIVQYAHDEKSKTVFSTRDQSKLTNDIDDNLIFIDDLFRIGAGTSEDAAQIAGMIAYDARDLFRISLNPQKALGL